MAITWQQVSAGNNAAVGANLLSAGNQNVQAGLQSLTNMANQVGRDNTTEFNRQKTNNTDDLIRQVGALGSLEDWEAAQASGQFGDGLKGQFGAKVDLNKVNDAFNVRDDKLRDEHIDTANFNEVLRKESDTPLMASFEANLNNAQSLGDLESLRSQMPEGLSEQGQNALMQQFNARKDTLTDGVFRDKEFGLRVNADKRAGANASRQQQQFALSQQIAQMDLATRQQGLALNDALNGATTGFDGNLEEAQKRVNAVVDGPLGTSLSPAQREQQRNGALLAYTNKYDLNDADKVVLLNQQKQTDMSLQDLGRKQNEEIRAVEQNLGYPTAIYSFANDKSGSLEDIAKKFDTQGDSGTRYKDALSRVQKEMPNATAKEIDYILTQGLQDDFWHYVGMNDNEFEWSAGSLNKAIKDYKGIVDGPDSRSKREAVNTLNARHIAEATEITSQSESALKAITQAGRKNQASGARNPLPAVQTFTATGQGNKVNSEELLRSLALSLDKKPSWGSVSR